MNAPLEANVPKQQTALAEIDRIRRANVRYWVVSGWSALGKRCTRQPGHELGGKRTSRCPETVALVAGRVDEQHGDGRGHRIHESTFH